MTANTVKLPLYLDYQATTPIDKRVLDKMMPYLTEHFGNPHSIEHAFGWQAEAAVELGRKNVAALIGARDDEVIFTSGATESNNIALKGGAYGAYPAKNHVITAKTEHECVLATARSLEKGGFNVTYLPVDKEGLIDLDDLKSAITDKTSLVSIMTVNNEIGVIQDMKSIGEICQEKGVLFHTDAAQAFGKIPLDVNEMNIDLMSISGHKIYGPKGIGVLYVRKDTAVLPLFDGGGQENGLRSGTLSPALCVAIGTAAEVALGDMAKDQEHISALFEHFLNKVKLGLNNVHLNGGLDHRFKGNVNLTFSGIKSDLLIADLKNIAISTGSACSSAKHHSSYVLEAIGLSKEDVGASVRVGFGRMTTCEEADYAAEHIITSVRNLL